MTQDAPLLLLLLLLLLVLFPPTDSASAVPDAATAAAMLDKMNMERCQHDSPPLAWRDDLALWVRDTAPAATSCQMSHTTNQFQSQDVGENVAMATGSGTASEFEAAIGRWFNERSMYNFANAKDPNNANAYHFSQVVWKSSTEVGCAYCLTGGVWYLSCCFLPGGNILGQFGANVGAQVKTEAQCTPTPPPITAPTPAPPPPFPPPPSPPPPPPPTVPPPPPLTLPPPPPLPLTAPPQPPPPPPLTTPTPPSGPHSRTPTLTVPPILPVTPLPTDTPPSTSTVQTIESILTSGSGTLKFWRALGFKFRADWGEVTKDLVPWVKKFINTLRMSWYPGTPGSEFVMILTCVCPLVKGMKPYGSEAAALCVFPSANHSLSGRHQHTMAQSVEELSRLGGQEGVFTEVLLVDNSFAALETDSETLSDAIRGASRRQRPLYDPGNPSKGGLIIDGLLFENGNAVLETQEGNGPTWSKPAVVDWKEPEAKKEEDTPWWIYAVIIGGSAATLLLVIGFLVVRRHRASARKGMVTVSEFYRTMPEESFVIPEEYHGCDESGNIEMSGRTRNLSGFGRMQTLGRV